MLSPLFLVTPEVLRLLTCFYVGTGHHYHYQERGEIHRYPVWILARIE